MLALPPLSTALILHPSPLAAEQAAWMDEAGSQSGPRHLTFDGLWRLLLRPQGARRLSAVEISWLLQRLLRGAPVSTLAAQGATESSGSALGAPIQATSALALSHLAPLAEDSLALAAVQRAVAELRQAGLVGARLVALQQASPGLASLAALLVAYEDALAAAGWLDAADLQRQAIFDLLQGWRPTVLTALTHLEVRAGTEVLGARLDLLNALAARGVAVTINLPWDAERPAAFAWPEAWLHAIEGRGHASLQIQGDDRRGTGPLAALRGQQFAASVAAAPVALTPPQGSSLTIWQLDTSQASATLLARQVAGWLAAGVPTQSVAVVGADPAGLQRLAPALQALGIPTTLPLLTSLVDTYAARLLLMRWRAAAADWPLADLLDLWEATAVNLETAAGQQTAASLAHWARQAGGLDRLGLGSALAVQAQGRGGAWPQISAQLSAALVVFVDELAPLAAGAPWSAWLAASAAWVRRLAATSRPAAEPAALVQLQATLEGWAQAAAAWPDGCAGAAACADWLEVQLSSVATARPPAPPGAVALLAPEAALGTRFSHLLLVDANADVWPRLPPSDPILTEPMRAELNRQFGPRLLQQGPLTGRGALPADARDTWLWLELLHAAQAHLLVTVSVTAETAGHAQSGLVDELLRSPGATLEVAPSAICLAAPLAPSQLLTLHAASPSPPWAAALAASAPAALAAWTAAMAAEARRQTAVGWRLDRLPREQLVAYLAQQVHGAARLDDLGTCRYRYFAAAVLNLEEEEAPSLGASLREEGTAAHAALQAVYAEMLTEGGLLAARLQPEQAVARAQAQIAAAAAAIWERAHLHPWLLPSAMARLLRQVGGQMDLDLAPNARSQALALEYRFDDRGTAAPALTLLAPDGIRQIRVRGSIDRVDLDGEVLRTLDYKRSARSRPAGRHFQLAIYAAVALRDLQPTASRLESAWRCLSTGGERAAADVAGPPAAVLAQLQADLWARLDGLWAGELVPDPAPQEACVTCRFAGLCRAKLADRMPTLS